MWAPETVPPLQISGYAPESNHVFAQLISRPPEFSQMPRLKSTNFYQNKPKIKLFLQKNKIFRVLLTRLILDVCCSYFQVLESYNEKLLS